MMTPHEIKRRQAAVARKTRRVERDTARGGWSRTLAFTRLGLVQGLALWIGIGAVTGHWTSPQSLLIVPCALMGGILIDSLRSLA